METYKDWEDFGLSEQLLASIRNNGFVKPTPIQLRSLKATLIDDKNVFGAAQTGSGKTLAFAIPILDSILKNKGSPSSILKKRIRYAHKRKEDFDLVDEDTVTIEDMIVDKDIEDLNPSDASDTESECASVQSKEESNLKDSCPEAVILVPTRELAVQVKDEIVKLCQGTSIKTTCLIGGLSQDKQVRLLKKNRPDIVIATPGRLFDIVQSDNIDHLNKQSLASIRCLVIDEADRMVQKGHFEELTSIVQIVNGSKEYRSAEFKLKIFLFSATLTFLHELPERFNQLKMQKSSINLEQHNKKNKMKKMLALLGLERSETRIIDLSDRSNFGRPPSEQLSEMKINCLAQEKDLYLYYFLINNAGKRTLVFCNSKDCLRRLSNILKYLEIPSLTLHAEMDQKKRMTSLEKFRLNPNLVLIATDVAARGLDVKNLDCVVHYQVPRTCESYIHRSGRTARLDKTGVSLTLCEPKETPFYKRLCNNINSGQDLEDYPIDTRLRSSLQERVALAQQCDKLDHHLRGKKSTDNWFRKAAQECDIKLDEDDLRRLSGKGRSREENIEEDARNRRRLSSVQKQLKTILKRPLNRLPKFSNRI